jgi:hypothetical protein
LIAFTSAGLQIQLNFSEPLLVSQGEIADRVIVKLNKAFFLNRESFDLNRRLNSNKQPKETVDFIIYERSLPRLVASQNEKATLTDQADSATKLLAGQFLTSFGTQFFLSGALSVLWNVFNTQQILVAL